MAIRRAESLLEALLAIFVVVSAITVALSVLTSNVDTTDTNRSYLVADLLANEAATAGQNILATNILRFGTDSDSNCWLVLPDQNITAENCDNFLIAKTGEPRETPLLRKYDNSNRGPQLQWRLSQTVNRALDLAEGAAANRDFLLYKGTLPEVGSTYYTNEETDSPSDYYRSIRFEVTGPNRVLITAKVQWILQGRIVTVIKEKTITK